MKRYRRTVALDGVDLGVAAGAIVGLVGPNGSGKTTALHVAAGLVRADRGWAAVSGAPAGSMTARRALALVPDAAGGLEELTVEEHTALVHVLHGAGAGARERAEELMASFGLADRRRTQLRALSRGLRRQASIVAALSLAPKLLLVDEATATLDPEAVVAFRQALAELAAQGSGVLVASQDLAFAERTCHEVVLLARGRVVERGPVAVLLDRYACESLEGVFLAALDECLPRAVTHARARAR